MISHNVITNTVFSSRSCHAAPRNACDIHANLVVFLCKSSETEETLALALFIPSVHS